MLIIKKVSEHNLENYMFPGMSETLKVEWKLYVFALMSFQ